MHDRKDNEKVYFFDKPENVKRLLLIFYISCALLFALDFVIHRHIVHDWESLWGFYPIYGFVGCVLLVFIAKGMRIFLMRSEDYYDKHEIADSDRSDIKTGVNNVDD
jgi:hypothetical protein